MSGASKMDDATKQGPVAPGKPRVKSYVATSKKELEEAVEVLAEAFAGSTTSAPEGSLDWILGSAMRSQSGKLYEKLSEPPSKKRMDIFRKIAKVSAYIAWNDGKVILTRNEDDGKIKGVACVRVADPKSKTEEIWSLAKVLISALSLLWSFGSLARKKLFRMMKVAEKAKHDAVNEKYLYVMMVGIHPSAQGQGVGKELLGAVCNMADEKSLPAYLEASGERNAGFYTNIGGFQVAEKVETISLPGYPGTESYSHHGGMNFMLRPRQTNK